MKRPFLTLVLFTLLSSQTLWAHDNFFGSWVAENTIWGRDVQFQLSFYFSPNETTLTVDCLYADGAHLQTSASSFVDYYGNDIYLRETKQTVSEDGIHFCRATLSPSTWSVYFDGQARMTLFMPVPYQSKFNLRRSF